MSSWEQNWQAKGIGFAVFFIIAYVIYGSQPKVGASAATLVSFYDDHRTRILIAAVILGLAVLCLLWFAAALSSMLRETGQGTWATAATAASAGLGVAFFMLITLTATLAYAIAGGGNHQITSGLNDFSWGLKVVASFPAAMLIMAGSFGLRQAGLISRASFGAGVAAVVLVLLGATTWAGDGIWAPDGAYTQFISPIIGLAWIVVVSGFLYVRGSKLNPSTASTPDRAAVSVA
jgi:hypothetical protein